MHLKPLLPLLSHAKNGFFTPSGKRLLTFLHFYPKKVHKPNTIFLYLFAFFKATIGPIK